MDSLFAAFKFTTCFGRRLNRRQIDDIRQASRRAP